MSGYCDEDDDGWGGKFCATIPEDPRSVQRQVIHTLAPEMTIFPERERAHEIVHFVSDAVPQQNAIAPQSNLLNNVNKPKLAHGDNYNCDDNFSSHSPIHSTKNGTAQSVHTSMSNTSTSSSADSVSSTSTRKEPSKNYDDSDDDGWGNAAQDLPVVNFEPKRAHAQKNIEVQSAHAYETARSNLMSSAPVPSSFNAKQMKDKNEDSDDDDWGYTTKQPKRTVRFDEEQINNLSLNSSKAVKKPIGQEKIHSNYGLYQGPEYVPQNKLIAHEVSVSHYECIDQNPNSPLKQHVEVVPPDNELEEDDDNEETEETEEDELEGDGQEYSEQEEADDEEAEEEETISQNSPVFRVLFDIDNVKEKNQFLVAEKIAHVDVLDPWCVQYDPINDFFLVASGCSDEVKFFPLNENEQQTEFEFGVSHVLTSKNTHGTIYPTGVAVIESGIKYVVLANTISVFEFGGDIDAEVVFKQRVVVPGTSRFRGIAVTPRKNILTLNDAVSRQIVIYDANQVNVVLNTINYVPIMQYERPEMLKLNPSFISLCGNRLVISDLGGGQGKGARISAYDIKEDEAKNEVVTFVGATYQCAKYRNGAPVAGTFAFISGVQVDPEGWMVVADAVLGTVQILNEESVGVAQIYFDEPHHSPYVCGLAINGKGEMLLTGRAVTERHITAYKIVARDNCPGYYRPPPRIGIRRSDIVQNSSYHNNNNNSAPTQGFFNGNASARSRPNADADEQW